MCGRFYRYFVSWEDYRAWLNLVPPDEIDPPEATFNAAPMSIQAVIRLRERGEGLEMAPMLWSLIPSWCHFQPLTAFRP